jgi:hypothetical protein
MNENIFQQVSLFIISFAILLYTGKYMLTINGVQSFFDFTIGMVAFYCLFFCANYFFKITARILSTLLLIKQKKSLLL